MSPLIHFKEFKDILDHYEISSEGKKLLSEIKMVLMPGPTSSGRTTIITELEKTGKYERVISDTTRKPRSNDGVMETDGNPYWFKSEEEMLENLESGKMLEAEVVHNQQVSGISLKELERVRDEDEIAIKEVDILGVERITSAKPDTFVLFVVPPSFEEWFERINKRGEVSKAELTRRLETAKEFYEIALKDDRYKIIVNDDLERTVKGVRMIVEEDGFSQEYQEKNKDVVMNLLKSVTAKISEL